MLERYTTAILVLLMPDSSFTQLVHPRRWLRSKLFITLADDSINKATHPLPSSDGVFGATRTGLAGSLTSH